MSLIVDIYQSRKSLARLEQVVRQLKQDVMQQMDVPAGQTEQTRNKLRDTVKQTVIQKVNGKNCNTHFSPTVISLLTIIIVCQYFAIISVCQYFGIEMIVNVCQHHN